METHAKIDKIVNHLNKKAKEKKQKSEIIIKVKRLIKLNASEKKNLSLIENELKSE